MNYLRPPAITLALLAACSQAETPATTSVPSGAAA